jgi:thioredoxin reductase
LTSTLDIAVVGAGPFGLSVAAHLQQFEVRTFGQAMETWRTRMPHGMLLRSAWTETSLSARGGAGSLDEWARDVDEPRREPIPLELFLRYGAWFADRFVKDRDPSDVTHIEWAGELFRLTTAAGSQVDAKKLVLSVGVTPFAYVPEPLREMLGESITLATANPDDAKQYAAKRVLVVGGGQAGLEASGLAAQSGATVELVTRSTVRWFADREAHYDRGAVRQRLYRLAYPVLGYGPPPLNRLVLKPDLFAALPERVREATTARILRSGGSPWLRTFVDRSVRITEQATIASVRPDNGAVQVRLTDGSEREVDHVLIACGYRFDLSRLSFLTPSVLSRIATRQARPTLDRHFRSTSDPNVFFVGYAAEHRFGPLSRFVLGTEFTATRLAEAFRG